MTLLPQIFPWDFTRTEKIQKVNYRGPRCNLTQAQRLRKSRYMSLEIFKQEAQCFIASVKANLQLFRSVKSTILSSGIRKQAARICPLQPIWNTAAKPPRLFYCSTHAATFSCSTSPLLLLPFSNHLEHIQFCTGLQMQLVSFPFNFFLTSPYLSLQIFPKWCTTWSLEPSDFLWYQTTTLKGRGSGLCGQTPNSNALLRAFSLQLYGMIFTPSIPFVISFVFLNSLTNSWEKEPQ